MDTKYLVSVVILNYRGKEMTEECIRSVLQSRYPYFEIVVVDNYSDDGSAEYLKKIFGKNKRIRILKTKKNLFFTGGFNFGAVHSKGDWVIFLSNDIVVDRDWIKYLVESTKNDEKCLVQPKILRYDERSVIDNVGGKYDLFGFGIGIGIGEKDEGQYDQDSQLDYASATTFMMNRSFFLELGGFDPWFYSHYEDCDLSFRAKREGGYCILSYKSKIYHRGSMTYKKFVSNPLVLFHVRKNRLVTIFRNFNGIPLLIRSSIVFLENIFFAFQDMISLKPGRMFVTVRAVIAAVKKGGKINKSNLQKVYA